MRLAIVSDIHGNLPALEAVIVDIKKHKPDMIVNLGDCVSGPLWPKETYELLRSLNWPTVRGNCDRAVGSANPATLSESDKFAYDRLNVQDRDWLKQLPTFIQISDSILACHGTPETDNEYLVELVSAGQLCAAPSAEINRRLALVKADLVLCGHSHIPQLILVAPSQLVLNPGSVGLPAYEFQLDASKHVVSESGSPHARYAIVTENDTKFNVEQFAVSYSHELAAQRAGEANRADYVQALRTGRMR